MILVKRHSDEALNEVRTILKERKRRQKDCLISSSALRKVLRDRFGVRGERSRYLLEYIIKSLVNDETLELWDTKSKTKIFKINKV